ncbi:MAG: magnesium transporter, partial [Planctomycetota bacterium]|nr:magnesium transporter [Planctomycetota bacterium]
FVEPVQSNFLGCCQLKGIELRFYRLDGQKYRPHNQNKSLCINSSHFYPRVAVFAKRLSTFILTDTSMVRDMINTLYLPELREMLADQRSAELAEFCVAVHAGVTADFMAGLESSEVWQVLRHADPVRRSEIFRFIKPETQRAILEFENRAEIAELIDSMVPDDRVDMLDELDDSIVNEILVLVSREERRNILQLREYPENTAGSVMTTDVAKLDEDLTVSEALTELGRQAAELETIYYLYVVDETDHLRGVVSAKQLVTSIVHPNRTLATLMEEDIVKVDALDDQEKVAQIVAKYDLLAIPVVNKQNRMLGIITHDDIIDVFIEEATEDVQRIGAVDPLDETYLKTPLWTLSWKRGVWLTILFVAALLTAFALEHYEDWISKYTWLVMFIPLVISAGGNSGGQSSTLIISSMARGEIDLGDWFKIIRREIAMGLILGALLGGLGFVAGYFTAPSPALASIIPITILLVIMCGTLAGSMLPLFFRRLGLDPAMMSNSFVAGIVDILGILIYMNVARFVYVLLPVTS